MNRLKCSKPATTVSRRNCKLWSACCSNGAETYSYAMYLHRLFQHYNAGCPMRVVGTDINETLVESAGQGRYHVKPDEWKKFRGYFDEM